MAFSALPPQLHERKIDCDPVYQGDKFRVRTKLVHLLKHTKKHLLGKILCISDILHHAQTEAIDLFAVKCIDLLECGRVSALRALDKVMLSIAIARCYLHDPSLTSTDNRLPGRILSPPPGFGNRESSTSTLKKY